MYIIRIFLLPVHAGADFIDTSFTITVPASETERGLYTIPLPDVFVIDDDINENCQRFALVAQIGSDVPDSFTCFKKMVVESVVVGSVLEEMELSRLR